MHGHGLAKLSLQAGQPNGAACPGRAEYLASAPAPFAPRRARAGRPARRRAAAPRAPGCEGALHRGRAVASLPAGAPATRVRVRFGVRVKVGSWESSHPSTPLCACHRRAASARRTCYMHAVHAHARAHVTRRGGAHAVHVHVHTARWMHAHVHTARWSGGARRHTFHTDSPVAKLK